MTLPEMLPSEYANTYRNEKTRKLTLIILKQFIEISTGAPVEDLDQAWKIYLSQPVSQITSDLMTFHSRCEDKYCPLPIIHYLSTVERYLRDCCEITLTPKQIRMRKNGLPKARAVTRDIALDAPTIKQIIMQSDTKMRALILMLCSSGMRITEALSILPEYIDLTKNPAEIYIPARISKNSIARLVYISDEAKEAYLAWMSVRDYEVGNSTARQPLFQITNAVFPYSANNERYRLANVLKKAGLFSKDPLSGRCTITYHSFRKFFISQFKLAANPSVAEALAGHEGYLDNAYRRIPEAEMQAEYLKAMPRLMINVPDDYYKVKIEQASEITQLQISAADQQALINRLLDELRQMRKTQELMNFTGGIVPRNSLQNDEYEGA